MSDMCKERHSNLTKEIGEHHERLNNHSDRIKALEQTTVEYKVEIRNLCKQLESLTNAIKFIGGPLLVGIIGFFFYAIQKGVIG